MLGKRSHLAQYAVDAEPDAQALFQRFEVDVAGAVLDGLADERVDDIDDRRVFGGFELRGKQWLVLLQLTHGFFHEIGNRVRLLDRLQDIRLHGHHRLDFALRDHSQIIDREEICRIRHRHRQTVAPFPDRNDAMALGQRQWNETGGLLVRRSRRKIDQGNSQRLNQHFQQDSFGDHSLFDQHASEPIAGAFLRRKGRFQLLRGDFSRFDQHFSQAFAPLHGGSSIQSPFLKLVIISTIFANTPFFSLRLERCSAGCMLRRYPEFCPLPRQAKPIIIKKADLTVAGGIFLEPYIGDVGILFLLLLTFLYHQWDSFFRE